MSEEVKNDNKIILSESVVNEILNYMGTKPFTEVAGLINKLMADHAKNNQPQPPVPFAETTQI